MNSNNVLTCGLSQSQFTMLADSVNGIFDFKMAENFQQIMDVDYFAVIINLDELDQDQIKNIKLFFAEVDGGSTEKIFITKTEGSWGQIPNSFVFDNFEIAASRMEKILDKALAKAKRTENLVQNISNTLMVFKLIKEQSGITTQSLAQEIGRNEAAVKRYIELLRLSGNEVDYDYEDRGWRIS